MTDGNSQQLGVELENDTEGKGTRNSDFETRRWLEDSMKDRDNNEMAA